MKKKITFKSYLTFDQSKLPVTDISVDKCYAKSLKSCEGPISREHFVSNNILQILETIQPEGIPWLSHREEHLVPNDLTIKCLCQKHNSYLSPMDSVAGGVFKSILDMSSGEDFTKVIVNGRLFERWFLKLFFGMISSKQIKYDEKLVTMGDIDPEWIEILFLNKKFPKGTGLFLVMKPGDQVTVDKKVKITTLFYEKAIQGLKIDFAGFIFYFSLLPKDIAFKKDHPHSAYIMHNPRHIKKDNYEIKFIWS